MTLYSLHHDIYNLGTENINQQTMQQLYLCSFRRIACRTRYVSNSRSNIDILTLISFDSTHTQDLKSKVNEKFNYEIETFVNHSLRNLRSKQISKLISVIKLDINFLLHWDIYNLWTGNINRQNMQQLYLRSSRRKTCRTRYISNSRSRHERFVNVSCSKHPLRLSSTRPGGILESGKTPCFLGTYCRW